MLKLSPGAATTFYIDVEVAMRVCGAMATAVSEARSLEEANDALRALGIRTELDLEREVASAASG